MIMRLKIKEYTRYTSTNKTRVKEGKKSMTRDLILYKHCHKSMFLGVTHKRGIDGREEMGGGVRGEQRCC